MWKPVKNWILLNRNQAKPISFSTFEQGLKKAKSDAHSVFQVVLRGDLEQANAVFNRLETEYYELIGCTTGVDAFFAVSFSMGAQLAMKRRVTGSWSLYRTAVLGQHAFTRALLRLESDHRQTLMNLRWGKPRNRHLWIAIACGAMACTRVAVALSALEKNVYLPAPHIDGMQKIDLAIKVGGRVRDLIQVETSQRTRCLILRESPETGAKQIAFWKGVQWFQKGRKHPVRPTIVHVNLDQPFSGELEQEDLSEAIREWWPIVKKFRGIV